MTERLLLRDEYFQFYHQMSIWGSQEEVWKDIEGFDGVYKISNWGRVKTKIRPGCSVEYLKPNLTKKEYLVIRIGSGEKKTTLRIHQLVAKYFIPNPYNLPEINHINENKFDNSVDNLEWCDHTYNLRYGTGRARGIMSLQKKVHQLDLYGDLIKEWDSLEDAAKALGIDSSCITRCCQGYSRSYRGYLWLYVDDENYWQKKKEKVDWVLSGNNMNYGKKRKVRQYTMDGELINEFVSTREAERRTGVPCSYICNCANGKQLFAKGYIWRYI